MLQKFILWEMRITHKPTGIMVSTNSSCFRSQHQAKQSLVSRLKSKLWVLQSEDSPTHEYVYDIGDNEFVEDLTEYKEKI